MLTVLVADADPGTRDMYVQTLAARGVRVVDAADGRDALVQIYSARPDALVLDVMLPFIDGLQLCTLVRREPATSELRIVAITNDPAPERLQRIRDRGADVVFVKPVAPDALATAVRLERSAKPRGVELERRRGDGVVRPVAKVRARDRYVTDHPPLRPPRLRCPLCDTDLQYDRSHIGGVSDRHPEQWDTFVCASHGAFQYRHRTRKLRQTA